MALAWNPGTQNTASNMENALDPSLWFVKSSLPIVDPTSNWQPGHLSASSPSRLEDHPSHHSSEIM